MRHAARDTGVVLEVLEEATVGVEEDEEVLVRTGQTEEFADIFNRLAHAGLARRAISPMTFLQRVVAAYWHRNNHYQDLRHPNNGKPKLTTIRGKGLSKKGLGLKI
jgi:hypothetical protein